MNQSHELFERAKKIIPGGVNSPVRAFRSVGGTPFFTKKASGSYLTTVDDKKLLDYVCTWGPAIHGHDHPVIREAISKALQNGTSFGTPGPDEVEMAELLVDIVPSVEKVRMCNSGTEATMSSIRLARGFTGKSKIIKFAGCYHGHVDSLLVKAGSGALTFGNPDSAGIPESFAKETIVLPYNDIQAVENAFAQTEEGIAAIIVEPYPANCGFILPKDGYLEALRRICSQNNAVLIFDEVMTGFRLGLGGVQERTGVTPDLSAMGKIIGGGLPVGAFGGKTEIMNFLAPLGPVYQAGTLSGNPLAMAAGIASLKLLRETMPYERLEKLGNQLAEGVKDLANQFSIPLQVPQVGSMYCLFFSETPVQNFEDALSSNAETFKKLFQHCLNNGVYLPPSAYETCFISAAHQEDDIAHTIDCIKNAFRSF
ncbi:MAG: glutamate-1-semialdehyde 2,1-aminomutase [Opitutae bacterium]|jgi:glutamate-1-semialdehyde 2,1-aminomutase|nr:glutamate-1-semialdehyde 2,1-aminomutase [Opitutae bacterium]